MSKAQQIDYLIDGERNINERRQKLANWYKQIFKKISCNKKKFTW